MKTKITIKEAQELLKNKVAAFVYNDEKVDDFKIQVLSSDDDLVFNRINFLPAGFGGRFEIEGENRTSRLDLKSEKSENYRTTREIYLMDDILIIEATITSIQKTLRDDTFINNLVYKLK